jgi:hypothetical protein
MDEPDEPGQGVLWGAKLEQKRSDEPLSGFPRTTLGTPGEGAERCEASMVRGRTKDLKAIVRPRPRF